MKNDTQIVARIPYPLKEKILNEARRRKVTPAAIIRSAIIERYLKVGACKVETDFAGPCGASLPCSFHG